MINVLHGKGPDIGSLITSHPDISAISFTGGTNTGIAIYQSAAKSLKKVSLELGGKNPTIIFKDVDLETMIDINLGQGGGKRVKPVRTATGGKVKRDYG